MTPRERFHRTMAGEPVDRPPLWGEGIREDVREAWAEQGFALDRDIDAEFSIERREQVQPHITHRAFRVVACNADDRSLDLDADDPERYDADWSAQVAAYRDRDFTVGLRVSRGILQTLGVGDWASLAPLMIEIADDPVGIAAKMDEAADFTLRVLERAFDEVEFDYILFSEPIASNSAPVIGPETYRRTCCEAYRRIVEHARARGVRWAVFQTYGYTMPLLPVAFETGMDAYWGGEVALSGLEYRFVRERFGVTLGLIGGIDAEIVGREIGTVESELRRTVVPLLRSGRYIPLLDNRVRSHVPFERYDALRTTLVQLIDEVCGAQGSAQ
jgi:hypothetical protein